MADTSDSTDSTKKELAKEIYNDLIHPAAQSTGELVALVPRAVKVALQPFEKWILQGEYNLAETQKLLDEKLKNVDPKNICSPEAHIAVPALQYISYCMDNEELRDMYANLLANSMNKVVKNGVHPAFVEIIRQLCPDEAKILRIIASERDIPTISLRAENIKGLGMDIAKDFSYITKRANCENLRGYNQYFDNLIRLGLLQHAEPYQVLALEDEYKKLEGDSSLLKMKAMIPHLYKDYPIPKIQRSYLRITSFGIAFCRVCLEELN